MFLRPQELPATPYLVLPSLPGLFRAGTIPEMLFNVTISLQIGSI